MAAFVSGWRISYNYSVELKNIHDWPRTAAQGTAIQKRLAPLVVRDGQIESPALVAGVDMAAGKAGQPARATVVVLNYPELEVVATETACGELSLPYILGLLSFRELPLILSALEKLCVTPDLFMVDGQGIAHPRRLGLASHLAHRAAAGNPVEAARAEEAGCRS